MDVVDQEHQGTVGADAGGEPVEPVQCREAAVAAPSGIERGVGEEPCGGGGSPREKSGALVGRRRAQQWLEQLTYPAEGQLVLEL